MGTAIFLWITEPVSLPSEDEQFRWKPVLVSKSLTACVATDYYLVALFFDKLSSWQKDTEPFQGNHSATIGYNR